MFQRLYTRCFSSLRRRYRDEIPLEAFRQKALLFENVSTRKFESPENVIRVFEDCGIKISQDHVHIMRNRFGVPCGRFMVLTEGVSMPNFDFGGAQDLLEASNQSDAVSAGTTVAGDVNMGFPVLDEATSPTSTTGYTSFMSREFRNQLLGHFPPEARVYVCDEHDVNCYVEQCERYLRLSDDLWMLADPSSLHRTVTVTGMGKTYGRMELADVVEKETSVKLNPKNIVFRFKSNGEQDSTAWLICDSVKDANRVLAQLQEVAVPKRFQYGALMGASFLYAARSSLFLSDPQLDFLTAKSKYQVLTLGWQSDVDEKELMHLANSLKLFPKSIKVIRLPSAAGSPPEVAAFFECDRMRNTKKLMVRLQMLKKRWKIPEQSVLYAYPKTADVRWETDNGVYDEDDPADDWDIDEPVHY